MTNIHSMPAFEAADQTNPAPPQDVPEAPDAAPSSLDLDEGGEAETDRQDRAASTPLEQVTDWSELERRLQATEPADAEGGPAPETNEDSTPEAAPADAPEDRALPRNFRFRTEDPQRARFYQLMRQHPDANPVDLARVAGYEADAGAPAEVEESVSEAATPEADPLESLRDEIAGLVREKRVCREAYEFDRADEVGERLLDARLELERKTREVAATRVSQARYDSAYQDARSAAARLHPATAQPGTKQHRLVRMLVAAKEQEAPEFFADPAYPLQLLGELERDFPEAFPRRSPAGGRGSSRPLGQAVAGTTGGSRPSSRAQLDRQIDGLSAEQLFALANSIGTQPGEL